jgi:hypothetical protein
MSSVKAFPLIVVLFIVVIIFTGINVIGQESIGNSNLDNRSVQLIININTDLNTNFDDLTLAESNLSANSTFEGQDPFVQQFLESKESTNQFEAFTNKIISVPDLLILGINDEVPEEDLAVYKVLLAAFIVLIIAVVVFVAIFGDGRIT